MNEKKGMDKLLVVEAFYEVDAGQIKRFIPTARAFVFEGEEGVEVRVIVSRDAGRWHISISVADRYPTWEEIKAARYGLVPDDAFMVMGLPPAIHYINLHPNAFQLWETTDRGLVALTKGDMPDASDKFLKRAGG